MKTQFRAFLRLLNKVPILRDKLAWASAGYLEIFTNLNCDHQTNGESWLLNLLAKRGRLSTCLDVGANHGDWTAIVLASNPEAKVHCFEVSPITYSKLAERYTGESRVALNSFGLSNTSGAIDIHHCFESDGLTSIIKVVCSENTKIIKGELARGDDYCARSGITKIDFLKIDVEGAENLVLEGFGEMLRPENISVIQFEYGMANIESRFLLKDFYAMLGSRKYRIGKLFPSHVRFREYRYEDEDFRGLNFIAASEEAAEAIECSSTQSRKQGH
jgi:FkbM family methyltransferase